MVPPAMITAWHSSTTLAKWTAGFSKRNLRLLWPTVPGKRRETTPGTGCDTHSRVWEILPPALGMSPPLKARTRCYSTLPGAAAGNTSLEVTCCFLIFLELWKQCNKDKKSTSKEGAELCKPQPQRPWLRIPLGSRESSDSLRLPACIMDSTDAFRQGCRLPPGSESPPSLPVKRPACDSHRPSPARPFQYLACWEWLGHLGLHSWGLREILQSASAESQLGAGCSQPPWEGSGEYPLARREKERQAT